MKLTLDIYSIMSKCLDSLSHICENVLIEAWDIFLVDSLHHALAFGYD